MTTIYYNNDNLPTSNDILRRISNTNELENKSLKRGLPKTSNAELYKLFQYTINMEFCSLYTIDKLLGQGGSGFVLRGKSVKSNEPVAIKFIRKDKLVKKDELHYDTNYGWIPMEVYILSQLDHPNIVKLNQYFKDDYYHIIVMSYNGSPWTSLTNNKNSNLAGSNDLFEFIETHGKFNEVDTIYIIQQLLSILLYLKEQNIYHGDIKDENILIDNSLTITLIDFGSAIQLNGLNKVRKFNGTFNYAPPEAFQKHSDGNAYVHAELCDVWSVGCLIYTLYYGTAPFENQEDILLSIVKPKLPKSKVDALLSYIFCHYKTRISFKQIVKHPLFLSIEPILTSSDVSSCEE